MLAALLACVLAQAPSASAADRTARLLEAEPTSTERLVRTLIAPLSAAGGVATGTGIGAGLGFVAGYVADLFTGSIFGLGGGLFLPKPVLGLAMAGIGAAVGGFIGYLMGIIGPGRLFEPTLSAQRRAILIGAIVATVVGGVWLAALLTGVLPVALPFLIAGSAAVAFAIPPLVDVTRPRAVAVPIATF